MKNQHGNLDRALAKARPFSDTRQWCGTFTPSEIKALVEAGVKVAHGWEYKLKMVEEEISRGDCTTHNFFFYPGKVKMRRSDHDIKHGTKR